MKKDDLTEKARLKLIPFVYFHNTSQHCSYNIWSFSVLTNTHEENTF